MRNLDIKTDTPGVLMDWCLDDMQDHLKAAAKLIQLNQLNEAFRAMDSARRCYSDAIGFASVF